jgi:CRP/FNR family transcriptional regulator
MSNTWVDSFPGLAALEAPLRAELEAAAKRVRLPQGSRIFGPGQSPTSYVLLIDGDIRVSQVSEGGREIVLYRVSPGESCALTTTCLLGGDEYQAEAIAETDVEAVAIPRVVFDEMIARSASFRRFVLAGFTHRVTDLFKLVDDIAFRRMDARLAGKLLELSGDSDELAMTHQQIAVELGTAREVVSRLLNELQRRGWVSSARGIVRLVDRPALQRLAVEG